MLPVGTILWAKNRPSDHGDHLHVEGVPKKTGTPPLKNPGMTDSVWEIFIALSEMFGKPKYFLDSGTADWSYMGWYNRRKIAGTNTWSQHAWSNAIDIGPYNGVAAQQKFYDFLTGVTPPPDQEDDTMRFIEAKGETGPHVEYWQRIMMAIDVPWKPTAYGVWNAHSIEELQDLTGPGENLGPGEAATLHARLAQQGPPSSGLNDAQVRQIVSETGRTLFVEKGQPVVIRGS